MLHLYVFLQRQIVTNLWSQWFWENDTFHMWKFNWAHTFNSSTLDTEVGRCLWVQGLSGPYRKFYYSQRYIVRSFIRKSEKKGQSFIHSEIIQQEVSNHKLYKHVSPRRGSGTKLIFTKYPSYHSSRDWNIAISNKSIIHKIPKG